MPDDLILGGDPSFLPRNGVVAYDDDGIILIDTLYDYAAEEAIVGGLKKLGLDPAW